MTINARLLLWFSSTVKIVKLMLTWGSLEALGGWNLLTDPVQHVEQVLAQTVVRPSILQGWEITTQIREHNRQQNFEILDTVYKCQPWSLQEHRVQVIKIVAVILSNIFADRSYIVNMSAPKIKYHTSL